ncbi:hypothetical protein GRI97_07695 [Altererythrobacter xixiisoli]|uniref:Uncharacterized protein n=1 Tax=Croceibacterium xixiisoli TaxID=1476466 RepID=A0A6I4TVP7_9SPHN|nr:hypothetical protein [Croceibacterium xixiisoli]MXO98867.1 hypothetical protein [Croceibacterium xixiisoli]
MTIRFAPSRNARELRMAKVRLRAFSAHAANDNAQAETPDDALLHAALRHFAQHGMAAAQRARKQSETAFFAGDRASYRWWLDICRILDKRLASQLVAETDAR